MKNTDPYRLNRLLKFLRGSNSDENLDAFDGVFKKYESMSQELRAPSDEERAEGDRLFRSIREIIGQARTEHKSPRRSPVHVLNTGWFRVAASLFLLMLGSVTLIKLYPETIERLARVEHYAAPGKRESFELSDGTVVSLNGGSTLVHSRWFLGDSRHVALTGEAFFDVARDENKPFTIRTGEVETKVLGTSFNVRSYASLQQITVSVSTGRVGITHSGTALSLLKPGEEITVDKNTGRFTVLKNVNLAKRVAWRQNRLVFDNYTMEEVATLLSNYYAISVAFTDAAVKRKRVTAEFEAGVSLERILQVLGTVNDFSYTLEPHRLTIPAMPSP